MNEKETNSGMVVAAEDSVRLSNLSELLDALDAYSAARAAVKAIEEDDTMFRPALDRAISAWQRIADVRQRFSA